MMIRFTFLSVLITFPLLAQWTPVAIPTNASFRALKTHGKHIWVSGTQGTVGHSPNAGRTWTFQQVPEAEKLDFRDLAIVNNKEVLLMSAGASEDGKALIFYTSDEGVSWNSIFQIKEPGFFFDCILWDAKKQKTLLLSDPVGQKLTLFTSKKNRFTQIDSTSTPKLLPKEAFFAASGSSMIQVNSHILFMGGGADSARIYTYQVAKNTWKIQKPGVATGEAKGYFSIGAKNKKEIWAVGGDYRKLNELSVPILTTNDGGNHWQALKEAPAFYMEKVIWAKPYWIVSGPSQSAAYHQKTNQWRSLGKSSYHNIVKVGDIIWGVGAKGQIGYISLSSIDELFLSEK
jgi:photosystem II stability/assembly factor-like uncharacterized protein